MTRFENLCHNFLRKILLIVKTSSDKQHEVAETQLEANQQSLTIVRPPLLALNIFRTFFTIRGCFYHRLLFSFSGHETPSVLDMYLQNFQTCFRRQNVHFRIQFFLELFLIIHSTFSSLHNVFCFSNFLFHRRHMSEASGTQRPQIGCERITWASKTLIDLRKALRGPRETFRCLKQPLKGFRQGIRSFYKKKDAGQFVLCGSKCLLGPLSHHNILLTSQHKQHNH